MTREEFQKLAESGVILLDTGALVGVAGLAAVLPKRELKKIILAVLAGDRLAHVLFEKPPKNPQRPCDLHSSLKDVKF